MNPEEWADRVLAYRTQGRSNGEIAEIADHLDQRGPREPRLKPQGGVIAPDTSDRIEGSGKGGMVVRPDFVARADECRHLARGGNGLLALRLADAGDRLVFWSPLDGGRVLNPKGPGLRAVGLVTTYARGASCHSTAFRAADLRMGRAVELCREPDNPYDPSAIALKAPHAHDPFGYVQRGRSPALARRIDEGEVLAALSLRGPGPGHDDEAAHLVVGAATDLAKLMGD